MRLTSFLQDRVLTIALTGEIDHHCAREFISAIKAKIEAYVPSVCILDYSDVQFMDSSGIAVIINALRFMNQIDGDLKVYAMRDQPKKVFMAAGMDKLVRITEVQK